MSDTPPLIAAVRSGNLAEARRILGRQPDAVHSRDAEGATALHYAAELGDRELVDLLLAAGAELNARDARFQATPAGWAIEYLRQRGGLLGLEIEDARRAIARGDAELLEHYLRRLPALRGAVALDGVSLREHAARTGNQSLLSPFRPNSQPDR